MRLRRLLLTCVLLLALASSALAGPPETPGYEGQQVTDSDGIVWVWVTDFWRMLN